MTAPQNNKSQANQTLSAFKQVRDLTQQVVQSLTAQREALKTRGMSLPPMVRASMATLNEDLERLETILIDEKSELGQLQALATMSAQINTSLDVDTVLQETIDVVIALTQAERGFLILRDEDAEDGLDFRIARDDTMSPLTAGMTGTERPQISHSVIDDVITTGKPMLTDNAYKDERLQNKESVARFNLRSVLCVPLLYQEKVIGVVYVDNRLRGGIFSEREMNTLTAFANTAAVAIENARMYATIQQALNEITSVKELMDNVFASVASGIIATDAEDVVTTFNAAASNILERSEKDTVGRPLNLILPKISADFADYLTLVREQRTGQIIDGELMTRSKGRIAVSMKLSPLQDANQETRGVALVVDDVTRQREREGQLRIMKTYLPPEMVDNIHTISNLALGGERRQVSCLFVEVRPFSTLKDVPPRQIMELLNEYLTVATDAIHATQGVIDKYMGNEIMALYNSQLSPIDNHALSAVKSALQMRAAFQALYAAQGINPQPHFYRVGIHTGIATLGNVGSLSRRDFTAIGDTINLSKRLQENAGRGQIIISEDTLNHLKASAPSALDNWTFEPLTPIQVKGRQQKTNIYEVFTA